MTDGKWIAVKISVNHMDLKSEVTVHLYIV